MADPYHHPHHRHRQHADRPSPLSDRRCKELTEQWRQRLSTQRMNALSSRGSSPAPSREYGATMPASHERPPSYSSLRDLPIVPTEPHDTKSIRFQNLLKSLSQVPLKWENPGLLDEALSHVPLEQIYSEADEESQIFQAEAESVRAGKKPAWGYQDCVIRSLLRWFKRSFFTWVNNPQCASCGMPTIAVGSALPTPDDKARGANQVELYRCSSESCGTYERFPRYNDAFVLLETRRGRCGEWANCFSMLCRAMGSRVRWIWNSEDHVWTEVYSVHWKRWIHVDACEEAWDKPRLYTEGWGKKIAYCIGFSADGAMDVTRRYVRKSKCAIDRVKAPEAVTIHILNEIRKMRRADMPKQEKFRLQGEDQREDEELRSYVVRSIVNDFCRLKIEDIINGVNNMSVGGQRADPDAQKAAEHQEELQSRQTGAPEWVRRRGENGSRDQNSR